MEALLSLRDFQRDGHLFCSRVKNLLPIEAQGIPVFRYPSFSSHRYCQTVWLQSADLCLCSGMWRSLDKNSYNTEMKNLRNLKNLSIRQSRKGEEVVIWKTKVESFLKKKSLDFCCLMDSVLHSIQSYVKKMFPLTV